MTQILNFKDHKPAVELSNKQLISKCASIGAQAPSNAVSSKYSFIPTIKAVDHLRDSGWVPVEAKQGKVNAIHREGFQQHVITFTKPDLDLGNRRIQMNLYNSHDAGSAYILSGGIYELVCSNGLVVGSNIAEYRHRHINFSADQFIESAKFVAGTMTEVAARVEDWEKIELEGPEIFTFADAAHDIFTAGKDHVSTNAHQLLIPRREADNSPSLWKVFNRIQENIVRGGLLGMSANGRRSRTRQITNIKKDKAINQQLWSMAEYMAEVKQAA